MLRVPLYVVFELTIAMPFESVGEEENGLYKFDFFILFFLIENLLFSWIIQVSIIR